MSTRQSKKNKTSSWLIEKKTTNDCFLFCFFFCIFLSEYRPALWKLPKNNKKMWHIRKNRKKRIRMLVHPLQERVLLIRKEIKKKVTLLFVNSSWVEGVNQIEKAKKNQKSVIKSQRAFLESTDLKKKNQIRSTYFLTSIINLKVFLMHVQLIYAYFFQLFLFLLARYLSDKLIPNWMSKNLQCTFVIDLLLLPSGSSYHYVLINDLISWSIEIEKKWNVPK